MGGWPHLCKPLELPFVRKMLPANPQKKLPTQMYHMRETHEINCRNKYPGNQMPIKMSKIPERPERGGTLIDG